MAAREPMVKMLIQIPKSVREEMRQIMKVQGLTLSQQARMSLALWVHKMGKDPGAAGMMMAKAVTGYGGQDPVSKGSSKPLTPSQAAKVHYNALPPYAGNEAFYKALAREPQPADPAEWASWSKRQGDAQVKLLTEGIWMVDLKKDDE